MNYTIIFVVYFDFIVTGVTAAGLPSEYTSEHGGVIKQEVLVYSEVSILDLSDGHNIHGKPPSDPGAGGVPER
jgi:hypothetical protein